MEKSTDEEWFAAMLQLLIKEAGHRLGPRGEMLRYLLEIALMEVEDMKGRP